MDGEPAELRDPAALVRDGEAHDAGARAVDLDDEAAEVLRLALGALDLLEQLLARRGASRREERVDVVVARQRDEELDVVGSSAADRHAHGRAGSTASGDAFGRSSPEPSATPARISTRPTTIHAVISSSSSNGAVEQRGDREQVRHEPGLERAVVGDDLHEDQDPDAGARDAERDHRGDRLPAGHIVRRLREPERKQRDRRAEHRRRRERDRVEPLGLALEEQARDRVEDRRDDHGERAGDRPGIDLRLGTGQDGRPRPARARSRRSAGRSPARSARTRSRAGRPRSARSRWRSPRRPSRCAAGPRRSA